ncbi:MAG: hypothetical protein HY815_25470 [Candidatus Riflebacteria bacterium]|nr:hypothetical protein [Candidatus Riflebacteria bacterium]
MDHAIRTATLDGLKDEHKERLLKATREGLQDILRRMLLLLPVFDADALAAMPLRRPTTIVPDTTAVHQGALDFVCRFLSPWARIKVPAIVHMELQNNADNYFDKVRFKQRPSRTPSPADRCAALRQHILSQGGIRTLLRLEFDPDVELDRGDLGADPLRGVITSSSDPEDKNLGLQDVVRSFADRLIVETARRFQAEVRPDHPLFVLTSDQGIARMALAEGLRVMFFQARAVPAIDGARVTGTLFNPFSRDLYAVSFADVLWELAVSFGRARVVTEDGKQGLDVWGIGGETDGATWQPLHAREDLLWTRRTGSTVPPAQVGSTAPAPAPAEVAPDPPADSDRTATDPPRFRPEDLRGAYRFSPDKMLSLIGAIVHQGALPMPDAQRAVDVHDPGTCGKYVRFLLSGQLVEEGASGLVATPALHALWVALAAQRHGDAARILRAVPSFDGLCQFTEAKGQFSPDAPGIPVASSALSNYLMLGEALGLWLRVVERGVCWTPRAPAEADFPRVARAAYERARQADEGGRWLLTGRWLEALALEDGIHPLTCRDLVARARHSGSLRVLAEGSTPDNRFDTHFFWALGQRDGQPCIERVYLYQGDFLLPGTAAVRLRIEVGDHAT